MIQWLRLGIGGRSWILGQLALALAFNERVGMKEKGLGRREGKGKERKGGMGYCLAAHT